MLCWGHCLQGVAVFYVNVIKFVKKNSRMTRELKLAGSEYSVDAVFFVKLISEYSIPGGRQYFIGFSKR